MKKITLFMGLFSVLLLTACKEEVPEIVTLELIGDETVWIEEGSDYVELGVLVNGVEESVSYMSTVNTDETGTYYVRFEHGDQTITRTIIVTEGPKTQYLNYVQTLNDLSSYSYRYDLTVEYTREGLTMEYYDYEEYDVTGFYAVGEYGTNSFGFDFTRQGYYYFDYVNMILEQYEFDEHSYWYDQRNLYDNNSTLLTVLKLDETHYVTKEVDGEDTIYEVFLNQQGFYRPYAEVINFIPNVHFQHNVDTYLKVYVTVRDDKIVQVETDLSDIFNEFLNTDNSTLDVTKYTIVYTFTNHDTLDDIVIPQEALQTKPTS